MDNNPDLKQLLEYYTSDSKKFPWRWYCDVPKYGNLHSYLCTLVEPFCHNLNRTFMKGNPSISEMKRLVEQMSEINYDPIVLEVIKHCEPLYNKTVTDRNSVEQEVFIFFTHCSTLMKDLESKCRKELKYL